MNADMENHIKIVLHALIFSKLNWKKKIIHHKIPGKLWEKMEADIFTLRKKYLCIVDYDSKFPFIKKTEDLSTKSLILVCKIIFSEYGLPKKIL